MSTPETQDKPKETEGRRRRRRRKRRDGRNSRSSNQSVANAPALPSIKTSFTRRATRKPIGLGVVPRRGRMNLEEQQELTAFFSQLSPALLQLFCKGMRAPASATKDPKRAVSIAVKAVNQGGKLGSVLRALNPRDRSILVILLQCGGLALASELHQELVSCLGGQEKEWRKQLLALASQGLVMASHASEGQFYYWIPEPLIPHFAQHLSAELQIEPFEHEELRILEQRAWAPALDFSMVSLCTYIDQVSPKLTQQREIFKVHREEMDLFFQQIWGEDNKLFDFHIQFLISNGLIQMKGDVLGLNHEVLENWLHLSRQEQNDLFLQAIEESFEHAEWTLWAIHSAKGGWVPERRLMDFHRRWQLGASWRRRFREGQFRSSSQSSSRAVSFSPLVQCGLLEVGVWGQEKFYRMSKRAEALLESERPPTTDSFYLTPNFEITAASEMLSPLMLFRLSELAVMQRCDRANTYRLEASQMERAMDRGWTREEIFNFLREHSATGMMENVEQTLRSWLGSQGDVLFHQCTLLTVHRSEIRRVETLKELKPFLLHRFAPGLYAVDASRLEELRERLKEQGFRSGAALRDYQADPEQAAAREQFQESLFRARRRLEDAEVGLGSIPGGPESLQVVPGVQLKAPKKKKKDLPPRVSPRDARQLIEKALRAGASLHLLYLTPDKKKLNFKVAPERLVRTPQGEEVLVGKDLKTNRLQSYKLVQIERLEVMKGG